MTLFQGFGSSALDNGIALRVVRRSSPYGNLAGRLAVSFSPCFSRCSSAPSAQSCVIPSVTASGSVMPHQPTS